MPCIFLLYVYSYSVIYEASTCILDLQPLNREEYMIQKLIEILDKNIRTPDYYTTDDAKYPITSISSNSFADSDIETLHIGNTIKQIHTGSFQNCLHLFSADLSQARITKLSHSLFYMCTSLSSIKLPSYIEEIEDSVFYSTNISEFIFTPSTKFIGKKAFYNTPLKYANLSETKIEFISKEVFYSTKSLEYCSIPPTCHRLGSHVFYYSNLSYLYGSEYLDEIGDCCFLAAKSLIELDLSKSNIKVIPYCAISCKTSVKLPPGLEEIHKYGLENTKWPEVSKLPSTIKVLQAHCMYGITGATVFDLSNLKITFIPEGCFQKAKISEVILPNTVREICDDAFYHTELELIHLGPNIESIGESAFYGCFSLKVLDLSKTNVKILPDHLANFGSLDKVLLPPTTIYIDRGLFYNNNDSLEVFFYGKRNPIGQRPFYDHGSPIVHVPTCYEDIKFYDIPITKDLECIEYPLEEDETSAINSFETLDETSDSQIAEEETSESEEYLGDYVKIEIDLILALCGIIFIMIVICSWFLFNKSLKFRNLNVLE